MGHTDSRGRLVMGHVGTGRMVMWHIDSRG
jgi:hypothetical protein